MKRVLIIAYYWPPNAGVGVFRWLKFARYLPQHGWQPVVYTPANPEMQAVDTSLLQEIPPEAEVIQAPIVEPYGWYKRFTGRGKDERLQTAFLRETAAGSWKEDLALWLRSNLFIPDARIWWVRPSVKRLAAYLAEHPVDAIVTTGSPHSLHLIGLQLKERTGIPWIADFRDPWTNIDYYEQLKLSAWADREQHRLEKRVLQAADRVITVSWTWAEDLALIGGRPVDVVTNGYDPADLPEKDVPVDEEWSLVHVGSITPTRDVPLLWKALRERAARDAEFNGRFRLRLIGGVDHAVMKSINDAGLGPWVERLAQVDHSEAIRQMMRARVLLLPVNNTPNVGGFLPAKVFEYLGVGRPIFAVAPTWSDLAKLLGQGHRLVERNDAAGIKKAVNELFQGDAAGAVDASAYTRQALTKRLVEVLEELAVNTGRLE
jgi:glycosyltransferase involved in cell wall biosynthesis